MSLGVTLMLASVCQLACQLQAQQLNSTGNRLLSAHEFLFSSTKSQPADKLKADMFKLIADSKAGRVAPKPQQLPAGRVHQLSRTAKIAIIAGVAVVVLTIVVVHSLNNLNCNNRCVL